MTDKTVLITGANGGLGNTVSRAFLDAGARVFGVSRSIREDEFGHQRFTGIAAELTSAESTAAIVSKAGPVDVVVHLVGGFAGGTAVAETPVETLDKMLQINLRTAYLMAQAVLPGMRERRTGCVLAIGSRAASQPVATLTAYAASKAALSALIRGIAVENRAAGITANLVTPGTIDTPANRAAMPDADPSRWVKPEQIAALLLHLASPLGSQISGVEIPIGD
ncbi:MAG: SDR family NAD(P)-dependent oxidoreductase [Bryobacterales bacterium]|nr:SDR family NAD(P)-dependent oxidoreductase [Bryobacterales bacterium]